jgi:GNAT superfamily N-acetyltransferase
VIRDEVAGDVPAVRVVHILFTPVEISGASGPVRGYGLAPMAVRPSWQRRGVGSALIAEGTRRLREAGASYVVVLGHPEYSCWTPPSRRDWPVWRGIAPSSTCEQRGYVTIAAACLRVTSRR